MVESNRKRTTHQRRMNEEDFSFVHHPTLWQVHNDRSLEYAQDLLLARMLVAEHRRWSNLGRLNYSFSSMLSLEKNVI